MHKDFSFICMTMKFILKFNIFYSNRTSAWPSSHPDCIMQVPQHRKNLQAICMAYLMNEAGSACYLLQKMKRAAWRFSGLSAYICALSSLERRGPPTAWELSPQTPAAHMLCNDCQNQSLSCFPLFCCHSLVKTCLAVLKSHLPCI